MFLRSSTVWTRDKRTVRDITFDAVGKLMHAVPQSKFDYQTRPPRKGSPGDRLRRLAQPSTSARK